jgi:hypothetical protein
MTHAIPGPDNQAVESGRHASDFEDRTGKTHYVGRRLLAGDVWQARGMQNHFMYSWFDLTFLYDRSYSQGAC